MSDSVMWRWHYYWWATETFDRSLPHWTSSLEEWVRPRDGWPMAISSAFAHELRRLLALDCVEPVRVHKHLSFEALRASLVGGWVNAVSAAYGDDFGGLSDFGVVVTRDQWSMTAYKFREPIAKVSLLPEERDPHRWIAARDSAFAALVGFEPEQCAHAHVVERTYDQGYDHTFPIGLCLRCCTKRSANEVTLHRERSMVSAFDHLVSVEPAPHPPARADPRRPSLSPPYAHHPGDRDRFPLGQAPGDATVFSAYLGGLRGRS